MTKRWHFLIPAGILIIGLILGSFFDLQINTALFDLKNPFGLVISSFGMIPGYGTLAFFGGLLCYVIRKKENFKTWLKVIFYILGFAMLGVSIYFLGKDVFSINGFYNEKIYWLGFVIMGVLMAPVFCLGYWFGKFNKNEKMWIIIIVFAVVIFIALVPGVTLFKSIMHRPRYRFAVNEYHIAFYNWWERCGDYKNLMASTGLTKEEFKSFPSGHAAATACGMICLTTLPLVNNKLMKYQPLLFYIGFGWTLVVMFARSLVGAHYLSDTCFGALITLTCFYIGNEIVIRKLLPKEESIQEQPVEEQKAE